MLRHPSWDSDKKLAIKKRSGSKAYVMNKPARW